MGQIFSRHKFWESFHYYVTAPPPDQGFHTEMARRRRNFLTISALKIWILQWEIARRRRKILELSALKISILQWGNSSPQAENFGDFCTQNVDFTMGNLHLGFGISYVTSPGRAFVIASHPPPLPKITLEIPDFRAPPDLRSWDLS